MPEYVCPNCRGGFESIHIDKEWAHCYPWCHQPFDGSHDPQPQVNVVRSDEDDEPDSILGRWLG